MFGLGMPEILLILAIALIVIGPKKLPELAKTLGKAMGEFKRSAQDFKRSIDVETTVKEFDDLDTPNTSLRDAVKATQKKAQADEDTPQKNKETPHTDSDNADETDETQSESKSTDNK